jgi:hypothetical protein
MFRKKLKTGAASGADVRVQLIRARILEEYSTSTDIFFFMLFGILIYFTK